MSQTNQPLTHNSEQALIKTLGQYLYQSINEEWLTAYMSLSCLNHHQVAKEEITKKYVCTAYYTCAFVPEHGSQIEDKIITTTDGLKPPLSNYFLSLKKSRGKYGLKLYFLSIEQGNLTYNLLMMHLLVSNNCK